MESNGVGTTRDSATRAGGSPPRRRRRWLRVLAVIIGGMLILVLAIAALFSRRDVRTRVLGEVIVRIQDAVPGNLTVAGHDWTRWNALELVGVTWTEGVDTLLMVDRVGVEIRPPRLKRDLELDSLVGAGLAIDIPAMQARYAIDARKVREARDQAPQSPLIREGSIAKLPSVAIHAIAVTGRQVRLTPLSAITDLNVVGRLNLMHGSAPSLDFTRLRARETARDMTLDDAAIRVDFAEGLVAGRGGGHIGPHWPFSFSATTDGSRQFTLRVTEPDTEPPPVGLGLSVSGSLTIDDDKLASVDFEALLKPPGPADLARDPALAPKLDPLMDMEGIVISAAGTAALSPDVAVDMTVNVAPNDWIDGGGALIALDRRGVAADSLWVRMDGLDLSGALRLTDGNHASHLALRLRGMRWLERLPFAPVDLDIPDSLVLDLAGRFEGPVNSPDLHVSLDASLRDERFAVDTVSVTAASDTRGLHEIAFDATIAARGYEINSSGSLSLPIHVGERGIPEITDSTVALTLAPITIRDLLARSGDGPFAVPPRLGRPSGSTLQVDLDGGSIRIADLRVVGDLGRMEIDATYDNDTGGSARIAARWPAPPSVLAPPLAHDAAISHPLHARWRAAETPKLTIDATVTPIDDGRSIEVAGSFNAPGPRTLAPLFPDRVLVEDLGDLRGEFHANASTGAKESTMRLDLDFIEAAWIDTAFAAFTGSLRDGAWSLRADSLSFAGEGVTIAAHAEVDSSSLAGSAVLTLDDAALARRVVSGLSPEDSLSAVVRATLGGTPRRPDANVSLAAEVNLARLHVPAVVGSLAIEAGRPTMAEIRTQGTMDLSGLTLDRIRASYRSTGATNRGVGISDGQIVLDLEGPDLALRHVLDLAGTAADERSGIVIRTDTLGVRFVDRDLVSRHPFTIRLDPDRKRFMVDDLTMSGDLGTITARGASAPTGGDFSVETRITVPPRPEWVPAPPGLWPSSMELTVSALTDDSVAVTARVAGLTLGNREDVAVSFEVSGHPGDVRGTVTMEDEQAMARVDARAPVIFTRFPAAGSLGSGPIEVVAECEDFPLPGQPPVDGEFHGYLDGRGQEREPLLTGRLAVTGTPSDPAIEADAAIEFPEVPELSRYRLELSGTVDPANGVTGDLILLRGEASAMTGHARIPGRISLTPPAFTPDTGGDIDVRTEAEQLRLEEFNALLPPSLRASGALSFELSAKGPFEDPDLAGRIAGEDVTVQLPDRSRALAGGEAILAGTGKRPKLTGVVEVENAMVRVPETPRNLLPADGVAMLWEEQAFRLAFHPVAFTHGGDDHPRSPSLPDATGRPIDRLPPDAELALTVRIPGGFWIVGRGLEVELAGELAMKLEDGIPIAVGELRPVRGQLETLGRIFDVEKGTVIFYGQDELNPTLDLALSAKIQDVTVRVLLTGTAQKPELNLTSEPEMEEGDIMSYLLFGKTLDELDQAQMGLVETRALDLARGFAVAKLQEALSRQLGVDLVRFRQEEGESGGSFLVIGKYLSRRALVKYEHELERGRDLGINLEYWLTRSFKLETHVSPSMDSGAEVSWSREY